MLGYYMALRFISLKCRQQWQGRENRKHFPSYSILHLGRRIISHPPSHLIFEIILSEYFYPSFVDEELETQTLCGDGTGEMIGIFPTFQQMTCFEPFLPWKPGAKIYLCVFCKASKVPTVSSSAKISSGFPPSVLLPVFYPLNTFSKMLTRIGE